MTNIPWEKLLNNRTQMPSLRHSAHMLECIAKVKNKFPKAEIVEVREQLWRLQSGDQVLSHIYNSHYACWSEAARILDVAGDTEQSNTGN